MNLSKDIEEYILGLLNVEEGNFISLRRKDLAERFECVPSQINYVLRSRFTPEQGYLIESRRGEHGYIKIFRITCENTEQKVEHLNEIIGDAMTLSEARRLLEALQEREFITARERLLSEVALRHITSAVQYEKEEYMYEDIADLLRNMLCGIVG